MYFLVGSTSGTMPTGSVWTFFVSVKWGNSSDFNAFTQPFVPSTGGYTLNISSCGSDAATFTRTYRVTVTNNNPLTGYSCTPYLYTSTVKASTQINVKSVDSGVTNAVAVNTANSSMHGCTAGLTTGSQGPSSGCCNRGSSGQPNPNIPCSTAAILC